MIAVYYIHIGIYKTYAALIKILDIFQCNDVKIISVMCENPQHTYYLLNKNPERYSELKALSRKEGDYSALVTIAVDQNGVIYVVDAVIRAHSTRRIERINLQVTCEVSATACELTKHLGFKEDDLPDMFRGMIHDLAEQVPGWDEHAAGLKEMKL